MQKNNSPDNNKKEAEYHKLNTKAVDRLVNANKMEIPKDQRLKDPAKRYRSDFLDRIPAPVKTLFLKFWFYGAICYFIFWGLGLNIASTLDMIFVLAVALGVITDILLNNIIRFIETVPGENEKWLMFPKKKFWTFFANILYAFIVLICVIQTYEIIAIFHVEPILFGLLYMGFDILFVGMKNLFITIVKDAKNKVNKQ